jgi:aryl-alcohol dehydrogenase-like predicted oxidoreductase
VRNYDPVTPVEETLRTLNDLVSSGKVRHIGLSDLPGSGSRRLRCSPGRPRGCRSPRCNWSTRCWSGRRRANCSRPHTSSASACCRGSVTSTLIGARRLDQLQDNISALDLTLSAEHRAELDEISEPELAFPASANRSASSIQFAGANVDGVQTQQFPVLTTSPNRY